MHIYSTCKRSLKLILALIAILLCIAAIPAILGIIQCPTPNAIQTTPEKIEKNMPEIPGYHRPMESTYLTFPEWYIVYSSVEYANYLKDHRPSGFPYFSSIEQYWSGYCASYQLAKSYPFNAGDHMMLLVIGTSFSIEYTIKGIYENTIGRMTEWLGEPVEEEKYAQKVAREYADFIPVRPWFEFSFKNSLYGLWQETSLTGPNIIRKWERKIILSAEYAFKAFYAWIIQLGSHAAYGVESGDTYARIKNTPTAFFKDAPDVRKVKNTARDEYIAIFPREQPFTDTLIKIIKTPVEFVDIAGNQAILVTAVAPKKWNYNFNNAPLLFTMPILTQPELQRLVARVPVTSLMNFLRYLQDKKIMIEHIYDY